MANSKVRKSTIPAEAADELLCILEKRFQKNMNRHEGVDWGMVEKKLLSNANAIWSVNEMEKTGGEPDVIKYIEKTETYSFVDCSPESPKGRRNLCYDREGFSSRKDFPPANTAIDMAAAMGIELLNEVQYQELQAMGNLDLKTSSWLLTPDEVRRLGGALFGDCRYGRTFVYHNGAQSYYGVRGFRGILKV